MTESKITPPPELVRQWCAEADNQLIGPYYDHIATRAAQWGWDQRGTEIQAVTDQELEACCQWVSQWCGRWPDGTRPEDELRAARRPKPPSLKEQALALLTKDPSRIPNAQEWDTIRRALEQLDD